MAALSTEILVSNGDPYYTAGTIKYQFFYAAVAGSCGTNCFLSPTPITAALEHMAANKLTPDDKTLYLEPDEYTEYVDVDGSLDGVKGLAFIKGLGTNPEDTKIFGFIQIHGFSTGFTLSNLSVINNWTGTENGAAIETWSNSGTLTLTDVTAKATEEDSTGIMVAHDAGTVVFNRVDASDNAYMGARIYNYGTGGVKITNSTFDNNLTKVLDGDDIYDCNWNPDTGTCDGYSPHFSSLYVYSSGPVTLLGNSVSNNLGDGANINAYNATVSVKNSIFDGNNNIEGVSPWDTNWGDGLWVDANNVVLENIQADRNLLRGIFSYAKTSFNGIHLHAASNGSSGIFVNSCFDWNDSDTLCDNPGAGTVTINTGSSSGNQGSGYEIYSKGAVTITNVYAGWNANDGIQIITTDSPVFAPITLKALDLPGNNNGVYIDGRGVITLSDFEAYDNSNDGVSISNYSTSATTLTNVTGMFNETRNNGGNGYYIWSMGPVTVTNLDTQDNGHLGGLIDNKAALTAAAVNVNVLAPAGYVNGYWNNGFGGLQILSRGAVTITRIMANNNGVFGLDIDNVPPGLVAGVPVTVSDGTFENNGFGGDGLKILSKGQITLMNIRANGNGGYGVYLDNKSTSGTAGVTINAGTSKGNEFQGNRLSGLEIRTNGAASLTNLYAANNGYSTYETLQNFSISTRLLFEPDNNFQFSGLVVYQDKDNFLQLGRAFCDVPGLCVGNGIYFDSTLDGTFGGENYATSIASPSEVYLRLDRVGNTLFGYYSANGTSWTLMGSHVIPNDFQINGVGLTAAQDIFESNPQIPSDFDNFQLDNPSFTDEFDGILDDGWVWINEDNNYWNLDETPGFLRIYNSNSPTGNQNLLLQTVGPGYGVYVDAKGAVTIKQVGGWGVQNDWAEGNVFSNNAADGLWVQTSGAPIVTFFRARDNGNDGIYIDASSGIGAVSLTGTTNYWENLAFNHDEGVEIYAKGNITLTKVQVNGNWDNGGFLRNFDGTGNVTLTDASFDLNGEYGLDIYTKGPVTWKNGTVNDNFQYGAYIDDRGVGKAVTLTNVFASSNGETGIFVDSLGAVTMTEVESNNNSANYYKATYGDWWEDNLNDDQVWRFDGQTGDDITVEITSGRFNPWVSITDPSGMQVGYCSDDNQDGKVTCSIIDLGDEGEYQIHVGSNNGWNGGSYEMKLYEGTEPFLWTPQESAANGINVSNSNGTGAVSISNSGNRWMGNNSGTGVVVVSNGLVTLKGMDLNDSRQGGVSIDNEDDTKIGAPGVTLTNVNFFNNDQTAVQIHTEGPVVITNGDMGGNWSYGYDIRNTYGTAISPITMTNVSVNNFGAGGHGIRLISRGAVTFVNVHSNGSNNDGIQINTSGAVTFTDVGGWDNGGNGANIQTTSTVTINGPVSGYNWFGNNSNNALHIVAEGKVALAKINANGNGNFGIYLINSNTTGISPITLTEVSTENNGVSGVFIDTKGMVSVTGLKSNNNGAYGLDIDQRFAPDGTKTVTLNKITANNNLSYGVEVLSKGSIITNAVITNSNRYYGVLLNNTFGPSGTITMLNTLGQNLAVNNGYDQVYNAIEDRWEAVSNGCSGVMLSSNGGVTVTGLETIYNGGEGLVVHNEGSSLLVKPAITINSIVSRANGGGVAGYHGIVLVSKGVITVNSTWSASNTGDGFALNTTANVFINNSTAIMNDLAGILVENAPMLKLTNSTWFGNLRSNPGVPYKNLMFSGIPTIL
ncbi:MAG: hypothetical protein HGA28_00545 [Anaerolineaceae bacterium]|nr:hypothetical protein [Anaerolineaceae bacterium]